jgi:hypothetical protein
MIYNGEYEQHFSIIIRAESHEACNRVAKAFRYLCQAWSPRVRFTEHRSARNGDVLERNILIYQTAYAHEIITFGESLNCIRFHYNSFSKITVSEASRSVIPHNSRENLLH